VKHKYRRKNTGRRGALKQPLPAGSEGGQGRAWAPLPGHPSQNTTLQTRRRTVAGSHTNAHTTRTPGMKINVFHQLSRPLRTTAHFRTELVTFAVSAAVFALRAARKLQFDS